MDQISQTAIALLRSALWGDAFSCSADTDWAAVTRELSAQAVLGVVAGSDIPPGVPEAVRAQWEGVALRQGAQFYRLLHAQEEMLALLAANDIHPVILKGVTAAAYYPSPEMRAMDDIDFLVPREQVERACTLMLRNGYTLNCKKQANSKHIALLRDDVRFELHRYFGEFDSAERMQQMDAMLQQGMRDAVLCPCAGSEVPMLPPLAHGLVLLKHIAGHVRDGLGLRHITDFMLYAHACLTDDFWHKAFRPAAQAQGLERFAKIVTRMCQLYLGLTEELSWCRDADREDCERLMRFVLAQGNFGEKQAGLGSKVTLLLGAHSGVAGWMRRLQASGMEHWEAAGRHALLRPFAWVYGGCRYARLALGRERALAQLREEKAACEQTDELIACLGLTEGKQKALLRNGRFVERKR